MKLSRIYSNLNYRKTKRWVKFLNSDASFGDLVTILFPIYEYVFLELKHYFEKINVSNHFVWDEGWLEKIIYAQLREIFVEKIIRTLVLELNIARTKERLQGETSKARYDYFISLLANPEFQHLFFKKYAILADKLEISIKQYLLVTRELFRRLAHDFEGIRQYFWPNLTEKLVLSDLRRGGDTHRQGRCVYFLEFKYQAQLYKLIYKPRSSKIDKAYYEFIQWLNPFLSNELYILKFLDKKQYGWFEHLEYAGCASENALNLYYSRLGYLLGVIYLLSGCDIHRENVIACGEHPVIVDLECLLIPIMGAQTQSKTELFTRLLVIDTFLLPRQQMVDQKYGGFDVSAFSGTGGEVAPQKVLEAVNPGTDFMTIERREIKLPVKQNIPQLHDVAIDPLKFMAQFKSGFIEVYNIFLKHRKFLLSSKSVLKKFKNLEIRVLMRNTTDYAKLLVESYHPQLLYDKNKRAEHFTWLVPEDSDSILNQSLSSEIRDLQEENIPIFNCRSNGYEIFDSHRKNINIKIFESGYHRIMNFIANILSEEDFRLQILCIDQSMMAYEMNRNNRRNVSAYNHTPHLSSVSNASPQGSPKQIYLKVARTQLDRIAQYAIHDGDLLYWTNVDCTLSGVWRPNRLSTDLYMGLMGMALTFFYAGIIFNQSSYKLLAEKALYTVRKIIQYTQETEGLSVGGISGVASILYGLTSLYQLSGEEVLLKDIQAVLKLCYKILFKSKLDFDIIGGVSGFLIVLDNCQQVLTKEDYTSMREACLNYIFEQYPQPHILPKDYPIHSHQPLLGFAHGVSGIAFALMHDPNRLNDRKVQIWIQQALEYERQCFSEKEKNWPDFRIFPPGMKPDVSTGPLFLSAWCHGATGIGLTRLEMKRLGWRDNKIDQEIVTAIQTTIGHFDEVLNLCHGSCGKLELLFQASQQGYIKPAEFEKHALAIGQYILAQGDSLSYDQIGPIFIPGLFTGAAGLAYQFMRFAFADVLPGLLLLESPKSVKRAITGRYSLT